MRRWEIINHIIKAFNYKSYLEIGIQLGENYRRIIAREKNGVDPNVPCEFQMTSDEFFDKLPEGFKYDAIFIDGLHHTEQVDKDILNSLNHLNNGGTIIVHDCNPLTWKHQHVPRIQQDWNGDVWKSIIKLKTLRSDLDVRVVDSDNGCAIIKRGHQELLETPLDLSLDYYYFEKHRDELLGLISPRKFTETYDPPWFFKLVNGQIYKNRRVDRVGFKESDNEYIPQEYLDNKRFVIFRTCYGLGDWGIISAMPRLLKEKYPDCEIYIPDEAVIQKGFVTKGELLKWGHWGSPTFNIRTILSNNPYIDGWTNNVPGEIYHDHCRIYDEKEPNIPLIEQMLKYWRFTKEEYKDSQPELYFSREEEYFFSKNVKGKEYGTLLISNKYKYDEEDNKKIIKVLEENPIPYYYWTSIPIEKTPFNFIEKINNLNAFHIRQQLYLKCHAKLNVGNQCGVNDCIPRYSKVYSVARSLKENYVRGQIYI